jgi:RNA polymerase subunit RPABC4/transcription elongation factor Spt4
MDLFGGLVKGLKPLMDATGVKPDESVQLAITQGEVAEYEGKKKAALAELGQAAYEMARSNKLNRDQLLPLCDAVDNADAQLKAKQAELDKAKKIADEKKREEEEKTAARTCPDCGEVNPEGTRFCQSCGSRLGIQKPKSFACQSCGAENAPGTRFCGECGAKLEAPAPTEVKCPNCKSVYPAGTKFCNQCGTRL